MSVCDILIPTINNPQYLYPCLYSLAQVLQTDVARCIVVNNGEKDSINVQSPGIQVIYAGGNKGWEGGLKLGLEHSKAPFVCFMNDDVFIPWSSTLWLNKLFQHFRDPLVAAVGPSSNYIAGAQNIWFPMTVPVFGVRFLIGLCMVLRRDYLDQAGGIDNTLPGGDDIDLSIRLRKLGYRLVVDRNVFVYHNASTTGRRIHGSEWDGVRHQEAYRKALWEKHGFKEFVACFAHQVETGSPWEAIHSDVEAEKVITFLKGDKIYDLGCGDKKTIPSSIGIDIVPSGNAMGGVMGRTSHTDVVANVFNDLPVENADTIIARHILEHTCAPLNALEIWKRALKPQGGRLIVAVPDEEKAPTIPMNPEHRSSFTKKSLKRLAEAAGLEVVAIEDSGNLISFVAVFQKNGN